MRRLLIRPGSIGDCILSLPALECLRAEYTEVWVASQNLPLIRFAGQVRAIASTGIDLLGLPEQEPLSSLLDRLRSFDSIVSWYGARRPEFRAAVESLGLPFLFFPALPEEAAGVHAADFYLAQARSICACPGEAIPFIDCPRKDGGFAVIHPFSGSPRKNWPLERYQELSRILGARMPVKWCVGPQDYTIVERGTWSVEVVRIDDLYALASWLAQARIYIGNDSGITHLAAAVGTPVVALFGPTNPAMWAPRGPHVRVVACGTPGQPMEKILLQDVMAAITSIGIPLRSK